MSKNGRLKAILAEMDDLVSRGEYDDAVDAAYKLEGAPESWNADVARRLELLSEHVDAAVFSLGNYWLKQNGSAAQSKAKDYYMRASESRDEQVAGAACLALGAIIFGETKDIGQANEYIRRSAELGNAHAQATWGMSLLTKSMETGQRALADEAMHFLEAAIDEGDLTEPKVFVAQCLLDGTIQKSKYDPTMLLSEAAVRGDQEAMETLVALASPGGGGEHYEEMLPYIVKPDGLKRPKQVRDALMGEFDMPQSIAEVVTSALYGCPSWSRLSSIVNDSRVPSGKFDEDLAAAEFNERRKAQAGVLLNYIEMPSHVADCAVDLLLPTAKAGVKPSLRRLVEKAERMTFKIGMNQPEPLGTRVLDARGMQFDLDNAMRFAHRVQPEPWLGIMTEHLGWTVDEVEYDRSAEGVLVGRAPSSSGTYDIYMSRVSHRPGDQGDEYVEKLMTRIAGVSERAVLLFNVPLAFLKDQKYPEGLLYGGKIKSPSRPWADFLLRPCSNGLEDALKQNLKFTDAAPRDLLDEFGFDAAGAIALELTQIVKNEEDGDHVPVRMGDHEWSVFVSRDFREAVRRVNRPG